MDLTITAQYEVATSVNEKEGNNLVIYPNPISDGIIYIRASTPIHDEVSIFDLTGNVVYKSTISNNCMNVSILKEGIYFMKIEGKIIKIIKK
ncbi:MAG: T9SS type A sorting domain-containing protein [Bacteroidales bacterium]|nr:T9SS type A sorting domain-containing protein [Bacteroidales bacterium]